jgi:hypothetical protein
MLIHFLSLTNHCLFVVLHPLSIDLFGGGDPAATALLFAIRKAVPYKLGNLGFAVFIPGGRSVGQLRSLFDLQSSPASVTTGDSSASGDRRNKAVIDLVMTNWTNCDIRSEEGGSGNTMALYLTIVDQLVISKILAKQLFSISSPHLP